MSKSKIVILLLILAMIVSACGGSSTPTPRPTAEATEAVSEATEAAAEPTEEATEAAADATEEATVEATEEATEEATVEATEEATEAATEEATVEVAMADVTEEPTEEATVEVMEVTLEVTEEPTEEATVEATEVAMQPTLEATEEATLEVTEEATEEATVEATLEVTEEATAEATEAAAEPTEEATVEATLEATAEATDAATGDLTPVSLQLQWVAQSQFCGYYAADAQGFYEDAGLDVTILEGAVDIVPQTVVASGGAEFGIAWVPKVLASRAEGADLVNIAQIFQRSGTLEVSFAEKGIESVEDLAGMRVGTWGFGNEHELFAALRAAGIDPNNADDVTIVQQPFDMSLLLNDEVDAAEAMTYNEYAQVLEQTNPDTGELYQPEDLNVIDFNEVGTAMLQDHIFTTESWLAEEGNEEIAIAFIKASIQGWIYCRDNFDEAVEIVLANGPTLGRGHMTWQLNEINKLIWPSPAGIGIVDEALWEQTVNVAVEGEVIPEAPSEGAYRTDLAQAAVDQLADEGVDVTGADYEPQEVEITPGGE